MATDQTTHSDASLTSLVSGIIRDAQELMRQEIKLAKVEFKDELAKTRDAALAFAAGTGVAAVGGLFLLLMVVHLINWASGDNVPLWGSYGIVGLVLAVLGGVLIYAGRNRAENIHLVPPQTAETMKENVQWIKNQT